MGKTKNSKNIDLLLFSIQKIMQAIMRKVIVSKFFQIISIRARKRIKRSSWSWLRKWTRSRGLQRCERCRIALTKRRISPLRNLTSMVVQIPPLIKTRVAVKMMGRPLVALDLTWCLYQWCRFQLTLQGMTRKSLRMPCPWLTLNSTR